MESSLGAAARFRRMEAGLERALSLLVDHEYTRAQSLLRELLTWETEENDGI